MVELTGDVTPDMRAVSAAALIVTTPEKWDGISRSWQTRNYVKDVAVLIIDEIHLLGVLLLRRSLLMSLEMTPLFAFVFSVNVFEVGVDEYVINGQLLGTTVLNATLDCKIISRICDFILVDQSVGHHSHSRLCSCHVTGMNK